jgi:hypothetical protein
MIKNVLIRGAIFGDRCSNTHILGNKGYTIWKIKFKNSKLTSNMTGYQIIDCIACNITDVEKDISKRIQYIKEEEFINILLENGLI